MYNPTANSYFSGAGLMDIGLQEAGIKIKQSLDLDKEATECMQANTHYFGHSVLNRSIEGITVKEQASADIAIGTYPCTHYSPVADLHGTRNGDDLFLHFFRHVVIGNYEMYIVENVPGMKKFKVVMEAMTQLPNYHVKVFCPVRTENWLPQRRDRLILIGTKKPFAIPHPENVRRIRMADIIEDNVPDTKLPDYVLARINGEYRDKPIIVDPQDDNAIAPTCVAHYSKDLGTRMVRDRNSKHGLRPFTIREYARLMGVPDDYNFPDKLSSYRLIGNGVPVPMARWCGRVAMKYFNQQNN